MTSGAQRGRRRGLVRKKSGGVGDRKGSARKGASSSSSSSHEGKYNIVGINAPGKVGFYNNSDVIFLISKLILHCDPLI